MAYEKIKFNSTLKVDKNSFISLGKAHIRFSSEFVRISNISTDFKVTIHKDNVERKLKFVFSKIETEDCLTLTMPKDHSNLQISASHLYNSIDWYKSVANIKIAKERQFAPKNIGNAWEISLMPSFENKVSKSEYKKIGIKTTGIYKYINSNGQTVYIGKGQIYNRLAEPQRKQWDFDIIEYSEISDDKEQFHWEQHWIESFKKENKGKLPIYNMINGKKTK
jgi:hypothetical protein